ncbi:MAG: hypothetical protein ACREBB_05940 [Nitrosotalea sp.]
MKTKDLVLFAFAALLILPQYAFADLSSSYTNSTQVDNTGAASVVNTALTESDTPVQTDADSNVTSTVPAVPVQDNPVPSTPAQTIPSTSDIPTVTATPPAATPQPSTQAPSTPTVTQPVQQIPPTTADQPVPSATSQPSTQVPASTPTVTQTVPSATSHVNSTYYQRSGTAPSPLKTVAQQWADNKASDAQFVQSIQQLSHDKTIQIPADHGPIPQWVKDDASMWSSGKIDYKTFASDIQYWTAHDNVVPAPVNRVTYTTPQPQQEIIPNITATAITPDSVTTSDGGSVTYAVTVTDTSSVPTTPTGIVSWSDGNDGGTFSSVTCTIYDDICMVTYTPPTNSPSMLTITASYGGDSTHQSSYGTASLQVTSSIRDTTVTITPSTTTEVAGSMITFTATLDDVSNPGYALSGIVSWSDNGAGGTFSPSTCVVSYNSCSLVYTPPTGSSNITVTASYAGDESDYGSSATAVILADDSPSVATSYTMNLQTDKSSYNPGENVTITSDPAGAQVGQNVAIVVTDPSLNIVASRAVQVGTQGDAMLQVGIPPDAQPGTYQVTSTALVGGNYVKGVAEFTVSSQATQPSSVSIVSIQPTDQEGNNVVTSFSKDTTGYVKIVLSSDSSQSALITVNLAGPDGTSLGVGSIKTSVGAGDTEMVVSFFVPSDANVGTGNIYADMFSDWPSNGGTPLTAESSGNVGIA